MKKITVKDIALTALFTAVITVSAWISIPFPIPLTLQVSAVVIAAVSLGYKKATASVVVYLLLGVVGLPVFSGFKGGLSVLLGTTGGFLFGLLAVSLIVGFANTAKKQKWFKIICSVSSLLFCWTLGAAWYSVIYSVSFLVVMATCVLPYVLPDIIKVIFGLYVGDKIKRYIQNQ